MKAWLGGIGLVALGCSSEPASDVVASVDGWAYGDLADDPLSYDHPADPSCPESTWGEEDGRLEVQTGACGLAWLVQPAQVDVKAGEVLRVLTWHQGLDAAVDAEAHLALVVDGVVMWEMWARIPSGAELFEALIPVEDKVDAGSEVGLHLHNHGFNSWSVAAITRS